MALASLEDLMALGAFPSNAPSGHPDTLRAVRLIEMASAQVAVYLATTELLIGAFPAEHRTLIAAVVAEAAARRLTSPAAFTADQLTEGSAWSSALLTPAHKRALDELPTPSARSSASLAMSLGDASTATWSGDSGGSIVGDTWT